MEVGQHLEAMNALSGTAQRDYRDKFIWPRIKRQEEASQLISALEDQLAQQGPQAGSHESSSSRMDTETDACIAVDCDHRRDQHDPVGDKRCHGCGWSNWHQSAMFLCAFSECAALVCAVCHGVLNARQERRQMDGAGATTQMQTNEDQATADSEP